MPDDIIIKPKSESTPTVAVDNQTVSFTRSHLVNFCAAGLGVSFFLPWARIFGAQLSGFLGLIMFPVFLVVLIVAAIYVMRNAVAMGLKDLDATLIKTPVIGAMYEAWFRKETYYRFDTRIMYCDTVNAVVKAKVEEVTGAKGIKLITFKDYSPILGELYKPTLVSLPRQKE